MLQHLTQVPDHRTEETSAICVQVCQLGIMKNYLQEVWTISRVGPTYTKSFEAYQQVHQCFIEPPGGLVAATGVQQHLEVVASAEY
jgi:hypothetical protein